MKELYKFFFCPAHGLFRPDNLAALAALWQQGCIAVFQFVQKLRRIL
jgi:hypothetical protein